MSTEQTPQPEKIAVVTTLSLRTAQGVALQDKTLAPKVTEAFLPVARACENIVLIQPSNPRGSFGVYIGAKHAVVAGLIGNYWTKSGDKDERMDVINVSIAATKNTDKAIVPVINAKTKQPVYQYTLVNTDTAVPMANLITNLKDYLRKVITASGLCPENQITQMEISLGDEVEVVGNAVVVPDLEIAEIK